MRKAIAILIPLILISVLLLAGCTEEQTNDLLFVHTWIREDSDTTYTFDGSTCMQRGNISYNGISSNYVKEYSYAAHDGTIEFTFKGSVPPMNGSDYICTYLFSENDTHLTLTSSGGESMVLIQAS